MKNLFIIIILAVIVSVFISDKDYVMIPSTSIRMRVIAASNSEVDQNNKLIVKSALEETIKNLDLPKNFEEADEYINSNKDNIDNSIKKLVNHESITFKSNYGYNYFPQKEWNGVVYPSGNYKSYVVTIGNGEGENWWCVMYPPLCLLDDKDEYTYRSLIKEVLGQYN